MKEEVRGFIRSCNGCQDYAFACDQDCFYELPEVEVEKPSRLPGRKAKKAEKFRELKTAKWVISSAKKQRGQKNLYQPAKKAYRHAEKNLKKLQERLK